MKYNYHTHTFRCGHAYGTEREYVESAIRNGIKKLGFSDHSVQFFDNGYVSDIRMKEHEAEGYVNCIRKLAEEYKKDIEIFVGFEAEYFPSIFQRLQSFCRDFGVDYLILGQHYLTIEPNTDRFCSVPSDNEEHLCRYVNEVLEAISTGSFSYIAHPDCFYFTGCDDVYDREMTRLCRGAKALKIPLEINMIGFRAGKHYPSDRFFSIAAREKNDIVHGADVHWPADFWGDSEKEKLFAFIKKHNITMLDDVVLRKI